MSHLKEAKKIYAYLDGEMSDEERLPLERHIVTCTDCQRRIAFEMRLRSVIKESLLKEKAPFYIKEEIVGEIEIMERNAFIWQKIAIPFRLRLLFSLMMVGIIILGITSGIFFYKWQGARRGETIFSQLAWKHIVYTSQEKPAEIESGDVGELVAWFRGKIDFDFSVPTFPEGPALLGGRFSEFHRKGAVHLIYQWGDCRFSFFVFKSMREDFPLRNRREWEGKECYTAKVDDQLIILWRGEGEVACALISDDEEELFEIAPQIM